MEFHAGDAVMHWVHGLGTILRLEERDILGKAALYYAVQIGDLTIWVPADKFLGQRLRRPTPKTRFKRLVEQLATPYEWDEDEIRKRTVPACDVLLCHCPPIDTNAS